MLRRICLTILLVEGFDGFYDLENLDVGIKNYTVPVGVLKRQHKT